MSDRLHEQGFESGASHPEQPGGLVQQGAGDGDPNALLRVERTPVDVWLLDSSDLDLGTLEGRYRLGVRVACAILEGRS
jgi:hypothetical protein